jgi:hypothetical protein
MFILFRLGAHEPLDQTNGSHSFQMKRDMAALVFLAHTFNRTAALSPPSTDKYTPAPNMRLESIEDCGTPQVCVRYV